MKFKVKLSQIGSSNTTFTIKDQTGLVLATGVTAAELLAGYEFVGASGVTEIIVSGDNPCFNSISTTNIVDVTPTTTTSTTTTTTTTTTTCDCGRSGLKVTIVDGKFNLIYDQISPCLKSELVNIVDDLGNVYLLGNVTSRWPLTFDTIGGPALLTIPDPMPSTITVKYFDANVCAAFEDSASVPTTTTSTTTLPQLIPFPAGEPTTFPPNYACDSYIANGPTLTVYSLDNPLVVGSTLSNSDGTPLAVLDAYYPIEISSGRILIYRVNSLSQIESITLQCLNTYFQATNIVPFADVCNEFGTIGITQNVSIHSIDTLAIGTLIYRFENGNIVPWNPGSFFGISEDGVTAKIYGVDETTSTINYIDPSFC
jgi:hypothetical protein